MRVIYKENDSETFACPTCGTKVLKSTGYCLKCKKKVQPKSESVVVENKGNVRVGKVKKNEEDEWMVPVFVNGKFNDDMTYYAGSGKEAKEDAEGTREAMVKEFKKSKEYTYQEKKESRDVYQGVLKAISEIKLDSVTDEEILRAGISAKDGLIEFYNRLSKITKDPVVKTALLDVAQEEKEHVREFDSIMNSIMGDEVYTEPEEFEPEEELYPEEDIDSIPDEAEFGMSFDSPEEEYYPDEEEDYFEDPEEELYDVYEEVVLEQENGTIILEKGDKFRIIKKEAVDPDLQKVADIADSAEGLFGLKTPLEKVFGKNNVSFWGTSALVVKTRRGRKIIIASPQNVDADGTEITVQGGNLLVGYGD